MGASPVSSDTTASHPIRAAMEARDHAAVLELLAPDVVLRSPVTATPFAGKDEVGALMGFLLEAFERWEFVDEYARDETHVLILRARIGGRDVDLADVLRHDEQGRVREIVIHARPLAGIAAFAAVLGPRIARRRGRLRAVVVTAITAPLPRMLATGDALVARVGMSRR